MGRILGLTHKPREQLRVALLGLLVATASLQAQTSQEIDASAEHVVQDIEHALDAFIRTINPWVSGIVAIGVVAMIVYLFRGRRNQPLPAEQNRDADRDSA